MRQSLCVENIFVFTSLVSNWVQGRAYIKKHTGPFIYSKFACLFSPIFRFYISISLSTIKYEQLAWMVYQFSKKEVTCQIKDFFLLYFSSKLNFTFLNVSRAHAMFPKPRKIRLLTAQHGYNKHSLEFKW